MNDNAWNIDNIARLERERVREEMRQIRLEESAMKARQRRPSLVTQAKLAIRKWLEARDKAAQGFEQRRVQATAVKREAGI